MKKKKEEKLNTIGTAYEKHILSFTTAVQDQFFVGN